MKSRFYTLCPDITILNTNYTSSDTQKTDNLTICPQCGGKVHGHGARPRQATTNGVKNWCQVQRFLCPRCKKTFTRLPYFLVPFKHYVASEIEGALRHIFNGGKISKAPSGAAESTLWRWRNEFSRQMQEWAGLLEAKIFRLSRRAPSFVRLLSHPLKRLEEALSHLPTLPFQWTVMVKTLWWLNPSHPLYLS